MNEVNDYSTAAGVVVGSVLVWAVLRSRMMSQVVVHSQRMFEQQRSQLEASFREVYESKLGEWKATELTKDIEENRADAVKNPSEPMRRLRELLRGNSSIGLEVLQANPAHGVVTEYVNGLQKA